MIRIAQINDREEVLNLYKELRPNDPSLGDDLAKSQWRKIIDNDQVYIIVADIDGALASTCALGLNQSIANGARPFGIIEHVVTAKAYQRRGLSRDVLTFAIDLAWKKNCYKVMLLSGDKLHSAHELYKSVGFEEGIEKGFVIKP